jgi:hypothetical protein
LQGLKTDRIGADVNEIGIVAEISAALMCVAGFIDLRTQFRPAAFALRRLRSTFGLPVHLAQEGGLQMIP